LHVQERADSFLDTSAFTKGVLWLGGPQPLGRIWNVGPQQTLYLPGPFLLDHPGFQSVVVFELNSPDVPHTLSGREQPILDLPLSAKP
jgi:beta-galactosidase